MKLALFLNGRIINLMRIIQALDLLRHKSVQIAFPGEQDVHFGDHVLLKNDKDTIVAFVKSDPRELPSAKVDAEYSFERKLSDSEKAQFEESHDEQWNRVLTARKYAKKLNLSMCIFCSRTDFHKKVTSFFFTSSENVDFRELVKDLAREFKTRIHLQRVNPQARAEIIGGYDLGGRENIDRFARFFPEKISMNVARDQGIIIKNNGRIFDFSGKLKGSLLYEVDQYRENRKYLPHLKQRVKVDGREGRVKGLDILNKRVKVSFSDFSLEIFDVKDIEYENKITEPKEEKEFHFPQIELEKVGI